ncbi:hypothetical protein ACVRWQ_00390 [Streptococcus phocae subsp. salmonis]|uniref:hypothetical protein n=1 Tax=Streptococcus phocae TaxID=119224 RepID=UPI00053193F6|nr:hypothetical protein [Streptococcus phocae]KGR72985.1 hypothetical protein NX86_03325 [Streptococcus phocae subsp. salmonis]
MDKLTNDAKFLISSMYALYIKRRKEKISKVEARNFQSIDYIKDNIMPEGSYDDILDICFELRRHDYISATPGDDTLYLVSITTDAIAELEVSFKDRLDAVLDYVGKIKNLIPFI